MLSFRPFLFSIVAAVSLVLSGCSHANKAKRHHGTEITGSVMYLTNAQLPDTATIEVSFVELNRDGGVVRVLDSVSYPKPPTMPLAFTIPYQRGMISKRQEYGIQAQIVDGNRTLFATPRPSQVITFGYPTEVEILVVPVK